VIDIRSEKNLAGVHPKLVGVVREAWKIVEAWPGELSFVVTEGLRTTERQAALVKAGASRTMNSKHITGHAVDLAAKVGGEVRWDWPLYERLNTAMQEAARNQGVTVTWGGSWTTLRDGPHFEISPLTYGAV